MLKERGNLYMELTQGSQAQMYRSLENVKEDRG